MTDETGIDIEPGASTAEANAVPGWFWVAAVAVLLWEAVGCFMYVSQVTTDPATLPLDQRAMWAATPAWMIGAYAVAVWVGLIGAVLLLMRRRLAAPVLLVSLIAVVVQFSALALVPQLRETTSSDMLAVPIFIIIAGYIIWQFAKLSSKRGWLR
ncbi:MAG: hypothetical protein H0W65_04200 [Sphingomonas sp.]|uniref:hypothetical protein n=1 Tax=Sphingomonas sp. TaxID=28214 RepID=UPI0017BB4057|nr:hypothetical protein [Sphingomonas sp.]MBA3666908.1 hypothetical protein [Sphingomonas sp.]